MKTTVDLPEDLLHRAKIAAVERKTTLREPVFQGLDYVLQQPVLDPEASRRAVMERLLERMEAKNTRPMVPLRRDEIYDR